jgi:hypothetical protein
MRRCHLLLISFDPADAAHGFRSPEFVVKMSYQDVQLTGLDRADLFAQLDQFCEAEKALGLKYGGSSCRAFRWL